MALNLNEEKNKIRFRKIDSKLYLEVPDTIKSATVHFDFIRNDNYGRCQREAEDNIKFGKNNADELIFKVPGTLDDDYNNKIKIKSERVSDDKDDAGLALIRHATKEPSFHSTNLNPSSDDDFYSEEDTIKIFSYNKEFKFSELLGRTDGGNDLDYQEYFRDGDTNNWDRRKVPQIKDGAQRIEFFDGDDDDVNAKITITSKDIRIRKPASVTLLRVETLDSNLSSFIRRTIGDPGVIRDGVLREFFIRCDGTRRTSYRITWEGVEKEPGIKDDGSATGMVVWSDNCKTDFEKRDENATLVVSKISNLSLVEPTPEPDPPTMIINSNRNSLDVGQTASLTFNANEAITGFTSGDIQVNIGSISGFTAVSGKKYTAIYTPPVDTKGTAKIKVLGSSYRSDETNLEGTKATKEISVDTSVGPAPVVTISANPDQFFEGETSTITFTFDQDVSDFTKSDVSLANGALSNLSGSGRTRTSVLTPTSGYTGDIELTIAAGTFKNGDDVFNTASASIEVEVLEAVAPTMAITSDQTSLGIGDEANITFTVSEATNDFGSNDVEVNIGSVVNFNKVSSTVYTAKYLPPDETTGVARIKVRAGTYTSKASGADGRKAKLEMDVDTSIPSTAPTVVLSANPRNFVQGNTSEITMNFSEETIFVDTNKIRVTDGSIGNLGGTNGTRTAVITPDFGYVGFINYTLPAGSFKSTDTDLFNTTSFTIAVEVVKADKPTMIINSSRKNVSKDETADIEFIVSEVTTDFTSDDVQVDLGSITNFSGSGTEYTATYVPPFNTNGGAQIKVPKNSYRSSITDVGGEKAVKNLNIDTRLDAPPSVTLSVSPEDFLEGGTSTITFEFNQDISGFSSNDVEVTNGSIGSISGSGRTRTAVITPDAGYIGIINITVPANSFKNSDDVFNTTAFTISVNVLALLPAPQITIIPDPTRLEEPGATSTISMNLSQSSTDFTSADVYLDPNIGTLRDFTGSGDRYTVIYEPEVAQTENVNIKVDAGAYTNSEGTPGGAGLGYIQVDNVPDPVTVYEGPDSCSEYGPWDPADYNPNKECANAPSTQSGGNKDLILTKTGKKTIALDLKHFAGKLVTVDVTWTRDASWEQYFSFRVPSCSDIKEGGSAVSFTPYSSKTISKNNPAGPLNWRIYNIDGGSKVFFTSSSTPPSAPTRAILEHQVSDPVVTEDTSTGLVTTTYTQACVEVGRETADPWPPCPEEVYVTKTGYNEVKYVYSDGAPDGANDQFVTITLRAVRSVLPENRQISMDLGLQKHIWLNSTTADDGNGEQGHSLYDYHNHSDLVRFRDPARSRSLTTLPSGGTGFSELYGHAGAKKISEVDAAISSAGNGIADLSS